MCPVWKNHTVTYLKLVVTCHISVFKSFPKRKLQFPGHQISWVSDRVGDGVRDFSPWASSATEAATETKFDIKVA